MILEKNKQHNYKIFSYIDQNKDEIREDNVDAVKLRKIAKKSEKIHEFTKERNKIEDKRLEFIKSVLNKRHNHIDSKLNCEYFKIKKVLNGINEKTVTKVLEEKFENNNNNNEFSSPSSKLSIKTNNSIVYSEASCVNSAPNAKVHVNTPINKIFTNNIEVKQNCKYLKENYFSRNYKENDDSCSQCESTVPSSSSSCSFFPCKLLTSYTSILGPKNDRKVKTAPPKLETTRFSNYFENSINSIKEIEIECIAKSEQEISKQKIENFKNNISIRRPLRQTQSIKDLNLKIYSLESKAKYYKEQNLENFKPSDRNIRYGEPLPRKKIYRQLKLLADFDR